MTLAAMQSDFTAGELASPSLLARMDLAKYAKGCRTLRNAMVQPHGGAAKRPGFVFMDALPGDAVLVPFVFNSEQTYCLVFGEKWMRVATRDGMVMAGASPYQRDTPYTLAQARKFSYAQSADVVFFACDEVAPQKLMREGHAKWEWETMDFSAPLDAPEWATGTDVREAKGYELAYVSGAAYELREELVSNGDHSSDGGYEELVFTYTAIKRDLYTEIPGAVERQGYELAYAAGTVYAATDVADPEGNVSVRYDPIPKALYTLIDGFNQGTEVTGAAFINQAVDSSGKNSSAQLTTPYTYYVTAVNADGKESGLSEGINVPNDGPASNNWQAGDYIVLYWTEVPGAVEYRVYKAEYHGRPGYIATVGGTTFKDHNVAPSVSEGAPKYVDPFLLENPNFDPGKPEGPGNPKHIEDYPGAVCLFEQRLVFASSPRRSQTIWMSKSGDYSNFATYTPQADDSPIELTLASSEVSAAKWMVPLRSLIIGTTGVEWEISSSDGAFTARTAQAKPQSYWGSSLSRAQVVGNIILHVSRSGGQVRNLQYDFAADSYGGVDLSILAAHLLRDKTIIDWTVQKSPDSIVWCVRSDGALLGLTFQNEHQISAWHRHDTQGEFLAVCSTPHRSDDTLFAVVKRNGKHLFERMADRYLGGDAARAVFLDSALSYAGGAASSVSGLNHLNGRAVGLWGDGEFLGEFTVSGGRVTLPKACSAIVAGLRYTTDIETMPVEIAGQNGATLTLKKTVNAVNLLFENSGSVKVGSVLNFGNIESVRWETVNLHAKERGPFTGMRQVVLPHSAENSVGVCIRSEEPAPLTVLGLVAKVQVSP